MGDTGDAVEIRIAQRLATLRAEKGWSLDALAERTGISRATLSRIENACTSPTAGMLGRLRAAFGLTLSRLMMEAEAGGANLLPAAGQTTWTDPETGFQRRVVAPPAAGYRVEIVASVLPASQAITYDASPVPGLEHEVVVLSGRLDLTVEGTAHRLGPGDCLRFRLQGASRYACPGLARCAISWSSPEREPMQPEAVQIVELDPSGAEHELEALARILHACVQGGASVSFLMPFTLEEARTFWRKIIPLLGPGRRRLLVARVDGRALGTAQIDLALPPNQPHRAEVLKVLVHPEVIGPHRVVQMEC